MLENENMIDRLGSLKEMSSGQLSQLIQEETAKESPNDDLVLMALDILEDREKENPVQLGTKGNAAWKKYQSKVRSRDRKTVLIWKPLMQVASVVLVITLLFALIPTQANAETWWERLARWTEDFFSFFNPNESVVQDDEYVFQTDNEGLQQVYAAAVELGVTDSAVPMWLPEEYSLRTITTDIMPTKKTVIAVFTDGKNESILQITVYSVDKPSQYYKDEMPIDHMECYGITHSIMHNSMNWIVVWAKDNYECSFTMDCQKDTLYEIIESIYRWRNINAEV